MFRIGDGAPPAILIPSATRVVSLPLQSDLVAAETIFGATIAVLTAEWAKRTRPDNIEALTRAHLGLTVSTADQTIRLPEIPERPRQEDAIAQALQAMGIVQADPVLTGSAR